MHCLTSLSGASRVPTTCKCANGVAGAWGAKGCRVWGGRSKGAVKYASKPPLDVTQWLFKKHHNLKAGCAGCRVAGKQMLWGMP